MINNKKLVNKILENNKDENLVSSFPAKLSKQQEDYYVKLKLAGDKHAEEILINHNMRLVVHIAKKFKGAFDIDDLISIGSIGLIKGVRTYNPSKNVAISTYLGTCISNEIKLQFRKIPKYKIVSLEKSFVKEDDKDGNLFDVFCSDEHEINELISSKVVRYQLEIIMKENLSSIDYEILSLRFGFSNGEPLTHSEIAKKLNMGRTTIVRHCNDAINTLKEALNKYTIYTDKIN